MQNSIFKEIIDLMIKVIYKAHTYFLSLNDQYNIHLTDKQLHFIIIGLVGILMMVVIYPLFKWMAKKHLTVFIAWFYVTTVLTVITFAIEIAQWYSNTGTMDFEDVVAGLAGWLAMSFVFLIFVGIIHLIKTAMHKYKK